MPRRRSPEKQPFDAWDETISPLVWFAADRTPVYCNAAWSARFGTLPDQAVPFSALDDRAAARYSPPPEVFTGERRSIRHADETLEFVPFTTSEGDSLGALLIVWNTNDRVAASDEHERLLAFGRETQRAVRSEYVLGESAAARRLRSQTKIAANASRIVIVSPPGCGGKEIARSIHAFASHERYMPAVELRCELHDRESFHSAIAPLFAPRADAASMLTVIVSHLESLASDLQRELATLIRNAKSPLRTICVLDTPVRKLVRSGKLQAALLAELDHVRISVPRLLRRLDDVPLLAQWFLERENERGPKQLSGFSNDSLRKLGVYRWPDGIDELGEIVRQSCARAAGPRIVEHDLPERIQGEWDELLTDDRRPQPIALDAILERVEREAMTRALAIAGGNKAEAARLLSISRQRLLRRLEQFGLARREEEPIDFQPLPGEPTPPEAQS